MKELWYFSPTIRPDGERFLLPPPLSTIPFLTVPLRYLLSFYRPTSPRVSTTKIIISILNAIYSNVLSHISCSQSGYTCMSLYRRDNHVMEVQVGSPARRQEDACAPVHFNRTALPYLTLVSK